MKRYEIMTNRELLNLLSMCRNRDNCRGCVAEKYTVHESQAGCIEKYLNAEIEMKPRWQTVKKQVDLNRIFEEFRLNYCRTYPDEDCTGCPYKNGTNLADCFYRHLSELVEVQE